MANWIIRTFDSAAIAKDKIIGDTSSSTFTITLPSSPLAGEEVKLLRVGTNQLNLEFIGRPYLGTTPTEAYINAEREEVSVIFLDETVGWIPSRTGIITTVIGGGGGS